MMSIPCRGAALALCWLAVSAYAVRADEPITLTLSPSHPTTADTVRLRAHFGPGCWDAFPPPWNPITIDGRVIHVSRESSPAATPVCGAPPEDFETVLPPLVEGTWTIAMRVAALETARAFEVTAPTHDLFLLDDRFVATADWRGRDGVLHHASAVALGADSGSFWFFGPENVELTLKVLDGSLVNGKTWVFVASTTDLAYTVSVVDRTLACVTTPCPNTRVYEGVAGRNRNVLDTAAFDAQPTAARSAQ